MNHFPRYVPAFLLLATSLATLADDRQNAQKQARKITAMATDKTGRRIVSMSIADTLKMPRPDMVQERRRIGLDYGSFFVSRELLAGGLKMADIVSALSGGKTIWQIGEEQHADWKRIASNAKKQNSKIEDYIYRHFLNEKNTRADDARDFAEKYTPERDAVATDFRVTPQEMVEAQTRYIFWRDEAGKSPAGRKMTDNERRAAGMDHADSRHGTQGISAPAAGGLPPQ